MLLYSPKCVEDVVNVNLPPAAPAPPCAACAATFLCALLLVVVLAALLEALRPAFTGGAQVS